MKVEIWKDIENFSKYQVSNLGNKKGINRMDVLDYYNYFLKKLEGK